MSSKKKKKEKLTVNPYFLLSIPDGAYDLGGLLSETGAQGDKISGLTDIELGSIFNAAGQTGASLIDTFTGGEDNRTNLQGKTTAMGVLEGAGTGAQLGSTLGPLGTAIGGAVGGIAGGITGNIKGGRAEEEKAKMLRNKFYGAYGGTLPDVYAMGGPMDISEINGPKHEQGGIELAGAEVEGGEVKVENYIFSDRLTPDGSKKTYAGLAKKIKNKYKERPGDAPSLRSMNKELTDLMAENEASRIDQERKDAELNILLEADTRAYGGYIKLDKGGKLNIDMSMRKTFTNAAKARGMSMREYMTTLYSMGGTLNKKKTYQNGGPFDIPTDEGFSVPATALKGYGFEDVNSFTNFMSSNVDNKFSLDTPGVWGQQHQDAFRNLIGYLDQNPESAPNFSSVKSPLSKMPTLDTPLVPNTINKELASPTGAPLDENTTSKNRFGEEELGLLMSNLPAMDNLIKSLKADTTQFDRVSPELISLEEERRGSERQSTIGRDIQRENIRSTATSSGQALSALSTGNAALTENLIQSQQRSFMSEENANAQIRNAAERTNVQISNQEIIANEQNEAMADTIRNLGLSDIGQNTQLYARDKKLTRENIRQNTRLMSVINEFAPHYKWEDDNGEFAIQFVSTMKSQNQLPKFQ